MGRFTKSKTKESIKNPLSIYSTSIGITRYNLLLILVKNKLVITTTVGIVINNTLVTTGQRSTEKQETHIINIKNVS